MQKHLLITVVKKSVKAEGSKEEIYEYKRNEVK